MSASSEYDDLLAVRWIRPLNEREVARLERLMAQDEAMRSRWEEDMRLLEGVEALPDMPVATNFTAQVLAQVAKSEGISEREAQPQRTGSWLSQLGWLPRFGLGCAVVLAVGGTYLQMQERQSMAFVESLAAVEQSGTAPSVEELQHLEEIQLLAQVPTFVDWELIAATD